MSDWITNFIAATEGIPSAPPFRLWTAIAIIAAAAEKKVYTVSYAGKTYPNMYIVLAGAPASGKTQAIMRARNVLAPLTDLKLGPDNVTNASFFDRLAASSRSCMNGSLNLQIFHSMAVISREFGTFIPRYDHEFLSALSDIFDNPPRYDMPRRTSISVDIQNPSFTLLSGVTPDFLGEILPEVAWGQGFTSRIIFIYGQKIDQSKLDFFQPHVEANLTHLIPDLQHIHELIGEFFWTEPARIAMNKWLRDGGHPLPSHGRMVHYRERRNQHIAKLSMISAMSAGHFPEVLLGDFERAFSWLITAEETMPDIFRAMSMKSDKQIIDDLHHHMYSEYMSLLPQERKPIHVDRFTKYLYAKVPHEKIKGIIETAINAGYFTSIFPNEYVPQTLDKVNGAAI